MMRSRITICTLLQRCALALASLILGTWTLAAEPVPTLQDEVSEATLANGMKIVVVPDRRLPVVTHMVWYKVGAADEEPGASGLAHFVEHLMFRSCNVFRRESFAQIISRLGGIDNATTNHDATYYYQNVEKKHLRRVMELEAARMAKLPALHTDIPPERRVILEERRSKVDTDPVRQLNENVLSALYRNHRYGIPSIGWPHEMARLDYAMAVKFHARHYTPDNAVLVVAGDVTLAEVVRMAKATYGKNQRRANARPRLRPEEPEQGAARRVELDDERSHRPTIFRYYLAPSTRTAGQGEAEALEILLTIVGGHEAARLQTELVSTTRVAASTGGRYYGNIRDSGRIVLFALAEDGKSAGTVERHMDDTISGLVRNGVTADEVARAKSTLEADYIFKSDSRMARAMRYGEALSAGRTVADVSGWLQRMLAVEVAEVNAAARKYLVKRHSVTGVLRKPLEGAGQ